MKRYLLLSFIAVINLVGFAASPKLASEKIFEDLDLYDPSLSITIMERPNQTVHTLSFKNKPDLQKKIKKALESDKEKAIKKSLVTDNGEISESFVIINDEGEFKIGYTNSKSKEVYFFVKKVYKNNSRNVKKPSKAKRASKAKKTATLNKRNKSPKSVKTLRREQMIDNNTLLIIETTDPDFLTEI
ncbi:MAG: hypothetical protein K2K75_04865 [Muribaculaceae bacterium]|nr:hypothetical protein [Muribaculaceae bacterium]